MSWRLLRSFLKWTFVGVGPASAALVMASAAVAASWPETRPWFASTYFELLRTASTPTVVVLGIVLVLAWATLFFVADRKAAAEHAENDHLGKFALQLSEMMAEQRSAPVVDEAKPRYVIQPHSTSHGHYATPVVNKPIPGLYIGHVYVSLANLSSEHQFELGIVGFNGSAQNLTIETITGRMRGGAGNYGDMIELPPAALIEAVEAPPQKEFVLRVQQALSPTVAEDLIAAVESEQYSVDLRSLDIWANSTDQTLSKTRLPLWDAIALRRRNDVVPTRVNVVAISAAGTISLSGRATAVSTPGEGDATY